MLGRLERFKEERLVISVTVYKLNCRFVGRLFEDDGAVSEFLVPAIFPLLINALSALLPLGKKVPFPLLNNDNRVVLFLLMVDLFLQGIQKDHGHGFLRDGFVICTGWLEDFFVKLCYAE